MSRENKKNFGQPEAEFFMVPTAGFEPVTYSLRMSCSTS